MVDSEEDTRVEDVLNRRYAYAIGAVSVVQSSDYELLEYRLLQ